MLLLVHSAQSSLTIDSAKIQICHQNYARGNAILDSLDKKGVTSESRYVRLLLFQCMVLDYEAYTLYRASFLTQSDATITALESDLSAKHGNDSLMTLFFLANSYGGKSIVHAKCDNWVAGLKCGLTATSLYKKIIASDSLFLPAWLSIGIYDYYVNKHFGWVPFIGTSMNQAINEIEKATRAPQPYDLGAKNALTSILIEQSRLAQAEAVVSSVLQDFPENTTFLRILAQLNMRQKKYVQVFPLSDQLLKLSLKRSPVNWADVVLSYQLQITSLYSVGKTEECRKKIVEFFLIDIPANYKDFACIKKNIGRIDVIKTNISH